MKSRGSKSRTGKSNDKATRTRKGRASRTTARNERGQVPAQEARRRRWTPRECRDVDFCESWPGQGRGRGYAPPTAGGWVITRAGNPLITQALDPFAQQDQKDKADLIAKQLAKRILGSDFKKARRKQGMRFRIPVTHNGIRSIKNIRYMITDYGYPIVDIFKKSSYKTICTNVDVSGTTYPEWDIAVTVYCWLKEFRKGITKPKFDKCFNILTI